MPRSVVWVVVSLNSFSHSPSFSRRNVRSPEKLSQHRARLAFSLIAPEIIESWFLQSPSLRPYQVAFSATRPSTPSAAEYASTRFSRPLGQEDQT
jgi:hypothetical protein